MFEKTLHLIVGSTGAGKTTFARKLSKSVSAVVFSIDDWMKALYWQDMPSNPDMAWFSENQKWYVDRIARCEAMIWRQVQALTQSQSTCILDLGFSTREHRARFIALAAQEGLEVEIHYLDVSPSLRWQRVLERQKLQTDTYVMDVDQGMFDYMESIFEEPVAGEANRLHKVS